MAIANIINSTVQNAVKSIFDLDNSIDNLLKLFNQGCPPPNELKQIIDIKNNLTNSIIEINSRLNTLQEISNSTSAFIDGLSTVIQVIKTIPVPTAVPPGIGIPVNILTILSDSLDILGSLISTNKAAISSVSPAINIINNQLLGTQQKLTQLDNLILGCLGQEDIQNFTSTNPITPVQNLDSILDNQLLPNSTNPFIYRDYRFETQYDPDNKFAVPRRRIKAYKINNQNDYIVGPWSYSSSTNILVNEIKFQIDQKIINQ
jgi:hypothetical protein